MLKRLNNGLAIVRHSISLLVIVVMGIVSITLLYSRVSATEAENEMHIERLEKLESSYQSIKTQQHVIIQQIEGEKENNKEFRDRTDRSLERILERLPARPSYDSR